MNKALRETVTWRLIAFCIDTAIVYVWTGRPWRATGLAAVLLVVKTIAFYVWRRLANREVG